MQALHRLRWVVVALFTAALLVVGSVTQAQPRIQVMGSSTDLIAVAKQIGQDRVEVYSPFPGYQEPELWVEEVFPSWAVRASRADMYIRIGLFADVWAEVLIVDSRNPRIFPGEPGYVDASVRIPVIEVPIQVDRARGEIHLQGNPHYLLDPLNYKIVADTVLSGLITASPSDAAFFTENAEAFKARIDEAMVRWQRMAMPLQGKKIAAYHKTWSYLANRFGFEIVGYVEPKPGIEPSPRDVQALVETMVRQDARAIIHAPVYSPKVPQTVAREVERRTGDPVRVQMLPAHVGGVPGTDSIFELFDYLLTTLVKITD